MAAADVQWFLDSRSRLKRRLDGIRSRGHYEHAQEVRERSAVVVPLAEIARELFPADMAVPAGYGGPAELLRDGPWYADAAEIADRRAAGEQEDLDSFVARAQCERADIALLTGGGRANSH